MKRKDYIFKVPFGPKLLLTVPWRPTAALTVVFRAIPRRTTSAFGLSALTPVDMVSSLVEVGRRGGGSFCSMLSNEGELTQSEKLDIAQATLSQQSYDQSMLTKLGDRQAEMAIQVIKHDSMQKVHFVGGLDVSFTADGTLGVGALVVLNAETMELVYSQTVSAPPSMPYIPGFLGFREVPYAKELIARLKKEKSQVFPQVLLVDGNGIYHPRECGFATQLGIELDIATIGVSKSFFQMDGMTREQFQQSSSKQQLFRMLEGASGTVWGAAFYGKCGASSKNAAKCSLPSNALSSAQFTGLASTGKHPIYVSIGHKVSLATAMAIVEAMSIHKVPEPIRLADKASRKAIKAAADE